MTATETNIPLVKIHDVDDLRLDTVSYPACGQDDVIIQVQQCGICGSDLGFLSLGGLMGPSTPMALGHELWGLVHQVGANIIHVAIGDRVVVQPICNDNMIGNGGPEGGFSPYLLVRNAAVDTASVAKIPQGIPDAFGPLVEPLAVAQHGAFAMARDPQNAIKVMINCQI